MTTRFLVVLSLCHTIITEIQDGKVQYNASSPDELALINMSRFCGIEYKGKDENNIMRIEMNGKGYNYELLHVLEFNSTRKRMSVILKYEDEIILYTKGADSIILDRTDRKATKFIPETVRNLADYGTIGLRTLLLAERVIPSGEFKKWNDEYQIASQTLDNRDEKMEAL
jgi:phospholipid-transporting ATPase